MISLDNFHIGQARCLPLSNLIRAHIPIRSQEVAFLSCSTPFLGSSCPRVRKVEYINRGPRFGILKLSVTTSGRGPPHRDQQPAECQGHSFDAIDQNEKEAWKKMRRAAAPDEKIPPARLVDFPTWLSGP